MKKLTLTIVFLLSQVFLFAQTEDACLPEGITFTTQSEIDNFLTNYPGCSEIEGNLYIQGNDITNLNGLSVVTSIGGNFAIEDSDDLDNLTGLDNLTSIGGSLGIAYCGNLTSLTGLENVTSIGAHLFISNSALTSLTGLDNLTFVGGSLIISTSDALTSLTGFDNFPSIIGGLIITGNPQLCNCSVEALCTYLSDPNGIIHISNNAEGCSSMIEVAIACGITLPCLLDGWYSMYSQFDVDHFPAVFPGCNNLNCNVSIDGNDITNLDSLANVTSIEGDLLIYTNVALTNLTGLDNLNSIGGYLSIWGNTLTNLSGLGNVTSIGGSIQIKYNNTLTCLIGLYNLTSIGNDIVIWQNSSLTSLTGLDKIDAGSINDLDIRGNEQLSTCEVQSICNYLVSPNGNILIRDNAPGCNSPAEVIEACMVSVEETTLTESFSISPNPANERLNIQLSLENPEPVYITVLNVSGQQMVMIADEQSKAGGYYAEIVIANWPAGIYFCRVQVGSEIVTKKIIKVR